jgi:predicted dehydrogenase
MSGSPGIVLGRRDLLAGAGAAGLTIVRPEIARGSQANSAVRAGLLGCGGRGTLLGRGLLRNGARITALADLFQDRLDAAKAAFGQSEAAIDASQVFLGPKAFQDIAASKQVDMVVIATPPYFHPEHLEAALKSGKHVYCEKPVAVDVPGCKRVLEASRQAAGRLSLDVGFQLRMAPAFVELIKQVHGGAIGEIACGEAHYFSSAIDLPAYPNAFPDTRRLRHWVHDRVLSGDILVEQNIHAIDICNWIMRDHPVKATGSGGRLGRDDQGDAWSHYSVTFFYPEDVHVTFSSTQFGPRVSADVAARFFGTRGRCQAPYSGPVTIEGDKPWTWTPDRPGGNNIDSSVDEKLKAFLESITGNQFHNQAASAVSTTLACIMGRTAAYTGKTVTWDDNYKSKETWDPKLRLDKL